MSELLAERVAFLPTTFILSFDFTTIKGKLGKSPLGKDKRESPSA